MSTPEFEAVKRLMNSISDQIVDCMTVCLVASERGDFETVKRNRTRLMRLRADVQLIKQMIQNDYNAAMILQTFH